MLRQYAIQTDFYITLHCLPVQLKVRANPASWRGYGPLPPEPVLKDSKETEGQPAFAKARDAKLKGHWNLRLSSFQKLVFIKTFQEEKVRHL